MIQIWKEKRNGEKILVTGGVGVHILNLLLDKGYHVIANDYYDIWIQEEGKIYKESGILLW